MAAGERPKVQRRCGFKARSAAQHVGKQLHALSHSFLLQGPGNPSHSLLILVVDQRETHPCDSQLVSSAILSHLLLRNTPTVKMLPTQRVIEVVLAFVMWARGAIFSFQNVGKEITSLRSSSTLTSDAVMSLLQDASKAPSQYNAVQRLHSRLDRKMHMHAAHRNQAVNSASAIRLLRAQAARPHPNMWRSMKVH